jgi:iron complex outermembrane receptor protein
MPKAKLAATFIIYILQLFFNHSFCQCSVSAKVVDSLKAPIPFITVALLKEDSSIYKGEITNEDGKFCFSNINKGHYFINVSVAGYADYYSQKLSYDSIKSSIDLDNIMLKQNGVTLGEISINAIKNPIEFKGGNITVNVDGSPLAVGNSVYDLIARLPGVMVEGDNMSIQGKSGVRVYINDRVQQLSGAQLTTFLRSMNSSVVEKIEIITNPPARYDAAGNAGIINIKTKKIKITGASGGLNYTFSQGFFNTNTGGFSLNYKGKKITFFSNTNFFEGMLRDQTNMLNHVTYNGNTTTMDQKAYQNEVQKYLIVDLGVDWYINKKNTIGVKAQAIPGYATRTYRGNTHMSTTTLGYNTLSYHRATINNWLLCNFNVNAEHVFDTSGTTKLKFSTDYYGPYDDTYKSDYESRFIGSGGMDTAMPISFRTTNSLGITIFASRFDFEKSFKKDLNFEAGIKYSDQTAWSDYTFENKNNLTGDYSIDSIYTNKFKYHEQISAAYFSFDKKYKKFDFRLGLRAENTDLQTESLTNSIKYTRHYFNVFPVIGADYNPNKNNAFSLSYNRRIDRPDYNSLNPFRSFNSVLSSGQGNPYLLPVYDNSFSFNYVYKGKMSNTFSYSSLQNPMQYSMKQNDSTKETVARLINMKELNIIRNNFFLRQEIAKWWIVSFLAGAYYIDYNGTVNGQSYKAQAIPWYTRLTNIFVIKKNTKIEVSGFYWSPWIGNTTVFQHREGLNLAAKRSFLNNNLNVSIALNDVFFTEQFRQKSDFQNQKWTLYEAHDSQRINVSVSYNFGKIKAQQRNTKENDEEKKRLGH